MFSIKFGLTAPMTVKIIPNTKNGIISTVNVCPNEKL